MYKNSSKDFYNEIASFYDDMINFNRSLEKRKSLLLNFIKTDIRTAADLGCGSGLDSIALSTLGLQVTAFDSSDLMIQKAEENAKANNQNITFVCSGLEKIPASYKQKFDIAFSLGNTLANIPPEKITRVFENACRILKDRGTFVLQILNYNRIIKKEEKIVGINSKDGYTMVRYYEFHSNHFNFNILRFNSTNPVERHLSTTKIYPYTKSFFEKNLNLKGFEKISWFGSLALDKYKETLSRDLIIVAKKMNSD